MHNILNADFMEFCHFILLPIEEGKCIIIISFDNLYSLLNDDMYFDFELKDLAKFNLQLSRVPYNSFMGDLLNDFTHPITLSSSH